MSKGFRDIYEEWRDSSTFFRIVFLIGLFISVSSLTSISETIIEWRGFIRDILNQWKILTNPIIQFLNSLNLDVHQYQIDYFALHMTYVSAYSRAVYFLHKKSIKETFKFMFHMNFKSKNLKELYDNIFDFAGRMTLFFPVFIFLHPVLIYFIGGMLFLSVGFMWVSFLPNSDSSEEEKKGFRIIYANLGIILLIFIILIAINIGLTAELG